MTLASPENYQSIALVFFPLLGFGPAPWFILEQKQRRLNTKDLVVLLVEAFFEGHTFRNKGPSTLAMDFTDLDNV